MIEIILAFIGKIFSSVCAEVLKDVLKTPAKEISVEEVYGELQLPSTPVDELMSDYGL